MTSVGTETESEATRVDAGQAFLDWTKANSRALTIVAVMIAIAAPSYWFYLRSKQITEANAEKQLLTAKQSMQAGNLPLAQSDFQKVYSRYESTPAGIQAGMILAQISFDAGKAQDGIAILDKMASSAPASVQSTVLSLQGDGLAQLGKPADAAKKYEAAAAATSYQLEKAFQQAKAARAYQAAGDAAKSRAIWTQLSTDPNSQSMASEARVRLGELSAEPAKR